TLFLLQQSLYPRAKRAPKSAAPADTRVFFFKQKTAYELGLGIPAEPLFRSAHADGWFIVFDTLTLADDRLEAFYDNPNALRDYFRDIGRMVLAAEGRKANDSHADCYQYFC